MAVVIRMATLPACAASALPLLKAYPPFGLRSTMRLDQHSYASPDEIVMRHLHLELEVHFHQHILEGVVTLQLERGTTDVSILRLDTRDLTISAVEQSAGDDSWVEAPFRLGTADSVLGAPLEVTLSDVATQVRIRYASSPEASGVQWLEPEQTTGKRHPFMFTQSQAIHARSWIPLQDSPGVRVTYSARVRTLPGLRAVMSATNDSVAPLGGEFYFEMRQPIPSYLIALAVGDLMFRPMSDRTGVYAEPSVVETAASEFADTEAMIVATERLYGPYRWERFDLLVLPPSFPFGGMENPRLTFATPTIIAGDKSLVSLVAHELAHSWSGNLVTNATWRDFWLNEGFTVYLERRILEEVFGRARAEMEATLDQRELADELSRLDAPDQILCIDLTNRDPDDGMTRVPYLKGELFLRLLEQSVGRDRFDCFLRAYFDDFAFCSITTETFTGYLRERLFAGNSDLVEALQVEAWLQQPGLPDNAPRSQSEALRRVRQQGTQWARGHLSSVRLEAGAWTTQEWLHFLRSLPAELTMDQLVDLDRAFALTEVGNAEIAHEWLLISIKNAYEPAYPRLESYLVEIGRRKLIQPLYDELITTDVGRQRARAIYERARPGYHPIATLSLDKVLAHH